MTDYNKYNTNLLLETAMKDPNMAEQVNQALGTISKPTSSVFPTGEFMGMSVSPRVQDIVNMLTQLPVGAGGAAIGAAGSNKSLLNKLLAKAKQTRATKKSIARHKNKPVEDFESRKISREHDKDVKDAYDDFMFGEAFNDQPLPPGVHDWKSYNKLKTDTDRWFRNLDQYKKSFEKAREDFMEGMHIQGLDEASFMRQLTDFETVYSPYSPGFDPKALLNLVRGSKGKKSIYDVDVQEGWEKYMDDYYSGEGGVLDFDMHFSRNKPYVPSSQGTPLQEVMKKESYNAPTLEQAEKAGTLGPEMDLNALLRLLDSNVSEADILHDAYTGGRFTPGMSSKTGSVPGGQTVKRTGVDPVQSPSGIEADYRNLILKLRGKESLNNFDNMVNSRMDWIKRNWDSHKVDMRYNRAGDKSFPKVGTKRYLELRNKLARQIGDEM